MLDYLRDLKNEVYDTYFFTSGDEKGSITVQGLRYKEPGEYFMGNLGHIYHIILFRENDDGELYDEESFEAVLIDPLEYMSEMINANLFGIFTKKTTTSEDYVKSILDNF